MGILFETTNISLHIVMSDSEDKKLAVNLGRSRSIKRINNNNSTNQVSKHVTQIITTDAEDESLQKYKQMLLGDFSKLNIKEGEPAKLEIETLEIICHEDNIRHEYKFLELDNSKISIKEGSEFDICLNCKISGDVLNGLRYSHILKKMGIKCHDISEMVGSYAPKNETQQLVIRGVEAPNGMGGIARGEYKVASALTDDNEKEHFSWNWVLKISKDW